ncbi:MAG: polymer-forming cytoskeletal protein [Spirochaetia bacterium]|nr:polymer-forming cytoskeletal protein [Spirochaetia bacterium]MDY4986015.1 polymer-forming cytoskeletal protein [Treponema sp.]
MADKKEFEKRNITVFGSETEFDGVLEFTDELIITGKFTGKINAPDGNLEIAKNSVCEVESIEVNSLVISGNVKGEINAKDRVEICSGSTVQSDITTSRFRIANNVDFNGDVKMLEKEPEVDLFSVASSEFKKAMIIHSDVVK